MKTVILTGGLSHRAGGLYYSVPELSRSIEKNGCEVCLCGHKDADSDKDKVNYESINIIVYETIKFLSKYSLSFCVLKCLREENPNIIHQQGIWSFLSLYTLIYKKKHKNCKTVIAPRGMLDPWIVQRSPIKKWVARKLFEDKNLQSADCMHALCYSEYQSMRLYGLNNPIAIIPNGTDIPKWERDYDALHNKKVKTMLFLSRLHPKKGVAELVQALSIIKRYYSESMYNWKFMIGGWGVQDYISQIQSEIVEGNLQDDVELLGAVYGDKKVELLKSVDAFILPTYSEGLPMAILEAWAYGLPVLTTDFANLPEGFEAGASYRIENDVKKLAEGIFEFISLNDDEIADYGKRGRQLAIKSFSWDVIGQKTVNLYKWLMGEIGKPDFVFLS